MRALTLMQPWAWAICHAGKRLENRPWPPYSGMIGERIAIHAGAKEDPEGHRFLAELGHGYRISSPPPLPKMAVVATAKIAGFVRDDLMVPKDQRLWWAGPFGWLFEDVVPLAESIPCKGALGLWNLPPDVAKKLGVE